MDKIAGEPLIGFGDFFQGGEVVGAAKKAPPKAKPKSSSKPAAVRAYPKPRATTTVQKHGQVLSKAQAVATHAAATIGKAMVALNKAVPKPIVLAKPHVGAAATPSLRAQAAVQKHNAAVAKANQVAKVLAAHTLKAKASVQALAKKMVAQKKAAVSLRKPKGAAKAKAHVGSAIGAEVRQLFQDYYDAVGAGPDPANRGFLTDGSPDPAEVLGVDANGLSPGQPGYDPTTDPASGTAATGSVDANGLSPGQPGYDPTTDPSSPQFGGGASLSDPTLDPTGQDSGQALPAPPDMSIYIADMTAVGGIAYDGSKGTPEGYVGSYGLMTRKTDHNVTIDTDQIDGTEHHGYVFGTYDGWGPEKGVHWGHDLASQQWNHLHGRYILGDESWHETVNASEAFTSNTKTSPQGVQYGPLVGNPALSDFAAMRVDGQGNMFWLPQEAPDWLTFPLKQAAALTAQAAQKAQQDALAADQAAMAKQQADAAVAQAQQDAQNALAESQAASQQQIAQGQAESDAQTAIVEQQKADTAQQQLETQQAQQAGDLLLAQAKRRADYLAQHPEVEFSPQGGGGDGGGGDGGGDAGDGGGDGSAADDGGGGDDENYDDGTSIPGGDVMQDADGEGYEDED